MASPSRSAAARTSRSLPGNSRVSADAAAASDDPSTLLRLLAKSRRAELRYRTLIDHAQEAMCILTPDGTIVDANKQAEVMHHCTRDELLGRNIRELVAPEYADQAEANYASLVTAGGGRSPAIPFVGPDGARRSCSPSATT